MLKITLLEHLMKMHTFTIRSITCRIGCGMLMMSESIKRRIIKYYHLKHHWQGCIINSTHKEASEPLILNIYFSVFILDYCSFSDSCGSSDGFLMTCVIFKEINEHKFINRLGKTLIGQMELCSCRHIYIMFLQLDQI